jgi:hypothetical protein
MMRNNVERQGTAAEKIAQRLETFWLKQSRIVVIGLGGIGSILARYLVLFLASLPEEFRVLLADGDDFEPNNHYRMDVPSYQNKAVAMDAELNERFGREGLVIRSKGQYLNQENKEDLIREGDFVLLCVDNHATRKLASDRLGELTIGVLISAGNDGVGEGERGTYGNVQIYARQHGEIVAGAPLDLFHPEIANPKDATPDDMDCMELAVQGAPQLLPINLAMASAMLSAVARFLMPPEGETMYDEVCLDILDATTVPQWLTRSRKLSTQSTST